MRKNNNSGEFEEMVISVVFPWSISMSNIVMLAIWTISGAGAILSVGGLAEMWPFLVLAPLTHVLLALAIADLQLTGGLFASPEIVVMVTGGMVIGVVTQMMFNMWER